MAISGTDQIPGLPRGDLVLAGHGPRVRRRPGERLGELFEELCDRAPGGGEHPAVDLGTEVLSYRGLDRRANRLARYLLDQGVGVGDRVGLLVVEPLDAYLGMLAIAKVHAAYVPLDAGFPVDRVGYILADAGADTLLTTRDAAGRVDGLDARMGELGTRALWLDENTVRISEQSPARLSRVERGDPADDLAYIIYTSGSTGRPKGVAIEHAAICNFVRVAGQVYGLRPDDRMYQGMTVAFDFSVEEIWVSWATGATLVPKPSGAALVGAELGQFLHDRRVTALCCVPTLLASVDVELPDLRFLLVSGEACPGHLVERWYRPDRRFLNVYGPTEACVTATYTPVHPRRPVTIGAPLPSYSVVLLDPEAPDRALPPGEVGEIGLAGIGLARGYVNRSEKTAEVFIDDFLGIPDNPSARIYRTGDLGRVTEDGEIEYLGRLDRQVKIRGYRIELTEIESVLLGDANIGAAVVDTYEPEPGTAELVAYCVARAPGVELDPHPIHRRLTENLPAYMVPAYLEQVPAIPLTTSDKADRAALPEPTHRYTAAGEHVPPANDTERALASALAETLNLPEISVTSHFFDELGGSSLLMTRFSARAREEGLPPLAIKDIYQHPTVRALASVVTSTDTGAATAADGHTRLPPAEPGEIVRTSTAGYLRTGAAQLLVYLVGALVAGLLLDVGYRWVSGGANWVAVYQRGAVFSTAVFAGVCLLPIALKWCLVGRWTVREIPLWGRGYLRFWLVKTLVRYNPMALFVGSPLYSLYLRALGANIGRNVVVFAPVPVATDLISIGEGTVVRQRSSLSGYRAVAGRIQVGPVTLGNDVVVAENTVLDIDTAMDDGARLGHASALLSGQRVPPGRSWHGSPAEPAGVDYSRVPPARCATPRKIAFTLLQLTGVGLGLTTVFGSLALTLSRIPPVARVMGPGAPYVGTPSFYGIVATGVVALFALALPTGILFMITVPRLLHAFVRPGKVYPLYGIAYLAAQLTEALTNSAFYVLLLGDSSFITRFARLVGYDLSRLVQTGSNFGTQHRHDSPYLTKVGSGTMISDGLAVINAEYSNTSFRLNPVVIGDRNFLGNNLAYPAGARAGDNVLLATKAMVPIDGPVREDVGLLGSPPFAIPRRTGNVGDDKPQLPTGDEELARGLARKNRYNARTIAVVLTARCLGVVVGVVPLAIAGDLWWRYGALALGGAFFVAGCVLLGYAALLERVVVWLHPLRPRYCTIYDPDFWHQERLWKFHLSPPLQGTPFQVLIWRIAGLRVGHRVFDDGCAFPEKALTTVGDDAVLNAGTVVQCHSLEDGYFVRDRATVGRSAVLGVNAFMHHGTTLGGGTVLDADSYLLKGEQVAPGEHWGGNPASLRRTVSSTPGRRTTHDGRPSRRLCH